MAGLMRWRDDNLFRARARQNIYKSVEIMRTTLSSVSVILTGSSSSFSNEDIERNIFG